MKTQKFKKITNGRMLKNYGSWMYCGSCDNTVGYLCYTTYDYFKFNFSCNCGKSGEFELGEKDGKEKQSNKPLIKIKNRLCCPNDLSPLFSTVDGHLSDYNFEIVCKSCKSTYKK